MKLSNRYSSYVIIISSATIVFGLIYLFSGDFGIFANNPYNTYSRQAVSWLGGRLDLEANVPWLELAIFEGRYYVSFPPFVSIIMLPFALFAGINTPDHLIALITAFLSLIYAYKLGERLLENRWHAVVLSLFLVIGTNYLHIALWGAVWYITQNMAFLLTLMAFYYSITENKKHSYIALLVMCAALGCRPFNIIYLSVVIFLIYKRENTSFVSYVKKIIVYAIPAVVLGAFFLWLNYARFGNILDFGHDYLPEFVNDPLGQFHISRLPGNLYRMFFDLKVTGFPLFYGFAFWLASPIVISYFVYLAVFIFRRITGRGLQQENDDMPLILVLLVLTLAHIVFFSFHRSMGGHQFGSRYTVDTLPAFYLGMLFIIKTLPYNNRSIYLNIAPMLFGLLLNFYGTVEFLSYYFPT